MKKLHVKNTITQERGSWLEFINYYHQLMNNGHSELQAWLRATKKFGVKVGK